MDIICRLVSGGHLLNNRRSIFDFKNQNYKAGLGVSGLVGLNELYTLISLIGSKIISEPFTRADPLERIFRNICRTQSIFNGK